MESRAHKDRIKEWLSPKHFTTSRGQLAILSIALTQAFLPVSPWAGAVLPFGRKQMHRNVCDLAVLIR